jgi:calcineurin-like phosphoesterase family protein
MSRNFFGGPRGFLSWEENAQEIIKRHNSIVDDNDDVYVLGDLMLGDYEFGTECIKQMKGKLHVILRKP